MADLSRRSREPELLDQGVAEAEAVRSLADLRLVNRWLGGRHGLEAASALLPRDRPGRLLDVGCGSADLPALLAERFGARLSVVVVDVKPLHLAQAPRGLHRVCADARALPFAPLSFAVVTASLFLHHFNDEEAVALLRRLHALARRGVVVNDLHRARAHHLAARLLLPRLLRSPVSVADGLTSIRRAFRPAELRELFARAGIPRPEVRRRFPFRLVAVAARRGGAEPPG